MALNQEYHLVNICIDDPSAVYKQFKRKQIHIRHDNSVASKRN